MEGKVIPLRCFKEGDNSMKEEMREKNDRAKTLVLVLEVAERIKKDKATKGSQ